MGVHNYKPWCDIQPNLKGNDTLMKLHPSYYGKGAKAREAVKSECSVTTKSGKKLSIVFYVKEGRKLFANFTYA